MEKEEDRARYSSEEEKLAYEQRGDREAAFFCDLELGWKTGGARSPVPLSNGTKGGGPAVVVINNPRWGEIVRKRPVRRKHQGWMDGYKGISILFVCFSSFALLSLFISCVEHSHEAIERP
jgi:hypothetical protein